MPSHTPSERKKNRGKVSRKIRILRNEGRPRKQAVAIALDIGRRNKNKSRKK